MQKRVSYEQLPTGVLQFPASIQMQATRADQIAAVDLLYRLMHSHTGNRATHETDAGFLQET